MDITPQLVVLVGDLFGMLIECKGSVGGDTERLLPGALSNNENPGGGSE